MTYLIIAAALLLSGIAAYYSVLGLVTIFVGAFWPVVIMGSALEFAKIVTVPWLYKNWKNLNLLMKSYLTMAILLLMLITSMGIFGFLSKAHTTSSLNSNNNTAELSILKQQEDGVRKRLDYLLARAKDPSTASNKLDRQIQDTQKELKSIVDKELPLMKADNAFSSEFGPLKYIANVIYGNNDIDAAVRLVIMIIMLVFDPLAMLLLICANIHTKEERNGWHQEWIPDSEAWPEWDEKEEEILTEEEPEIYYHPEVAEVAKPEPKKEEPVVQSGLEMGPRKEHHAEGIHSEHHT